MSDEKKKNNDDKKIDDLGLSDKGEKWGDFSKITEEDWSSAVDDWDIDIPLVEDAAEKETDAVTQEATGEKDEIEVAAKESPPARSEQGGDDEPEFEKAAEDQDADQSGSAASDDDFELPDLDENLDLLFSQGEALGDLLGGDGSGEAGAAESVEDSGGGFDEEETRLVDSMDDLIKKSAQDDAGTEGFADEATKIGGEEMTDLLEQSREEEPPEPVVAMDDDFYDTIMVDDGGKELEEVKIEADDDLLDLGSDEELNSALAAMKSESTLLESDMESGSMTQPTEGDSEEAEERAEEEAEERADEAKESGDEETEERADEEAEERADEEAEERADEEAEERADEETEERAEETEERADEETEERADEETEDGDTASDELGKDVSDLVSDISDELVGDEEEVVVKRAHEEDALIESSPAEEGMLSGEDEGVADSDKSPAPEPAGFLSSEENGDDALGVLSDIGIEGEGEPGEGLGGLLDGADELLPGGDLGATSPGFSEEITSGVDAIVRSFRVLPPAVEERELADLEPDSDEIPEPLYKKKPAEPLVPAYSEELLGDYSSDGEAEGAPFDWRGMIDSLLRQLGSSEDDSESGGLELSLGQVYDFGEKQHDEAWAHYLESRNLGGGGVDDTWFLLRSQLKAKDWSGAAEVCAGLVDEKEASDSLGLVLAQGLRAELSFWCMSDISKARELFGKLEGFSGGGHWGLLGKMDADISEADLEEYAVHLTTLAEGIPLDVLGAELLFMSGRVHQVLGQFDKALESYEKCLQADIGHGMEVKRWAQRGCHGCLYALGNWREAASRWERLLDFAQGPREEGVWTWLLSQHYSARLKDHEGALIWAKRSIEALKDNVPRLVERYYSHLLEKTGRNEDLIAALRASAESETDEKARGAKLFALGFEMERGKEDDAVARDTYLEALSHDPEIKAVLSGVRRTFSGDDDRALELEWRQSNAKKPQVVSYLGFRRYLAAMGKEDSENGLDALIESFEADPSNPAIQWELAGAAAGVLSAEKIKEYLEAGFEGLDQDVEEAVFLRWLGGSIEDSSEAADESSWWRKLLETDLGMRASLERIELELQSNFKQSDKYEEMLTMEGERGGGERSGWAWARSGIKALSGNELDTAEERFQRAMEMQGDALEPLWGLLQVGARRKDWQGLNNIFLERLSDLDLSSSPALLTQIRRGSLLEWCTDELTETAEAYATAVESAPDMNLLRRGLYRVLLMEGYINQASEEMERLVRAKKGRGEQDAKVNSALGSLMEWADRADRAAEYYRKIDTKDPVLKMTIEELHVSLGNWPVLADEALGALQVAEEAGDKEEKIRAYERLARIDRDGRGEEFSAMMSYSSILELDSNHLKAQRELEIYSAKNKRWEDLLRVYGQMADTPGCKNDREALLLAGAFLACRMRRDEICRDSFCAALDESSPRYVVLRFLDDYARKSGDRELLARCAEGYSALFSDDDVIASIASNLAGDCYSIMAGEVMGELSDLRSGDESGEPDIAESEQSKDDESQAPGSDESESQISDEEAVRESGDSASEDESGAGESGAGESGAGESEAGESEAGVDVDDSEAGEETKGGLTAEHDASEGEETGAESEAQEHEAEDVEEKDSLSGKVEGEQAGINAEAESELLDRLEEYKSKAFDRYRKAVTVYERNLCSSLYWRFLAFDTEDWLGAVDALEQGDRASVIPERQADDLVSAGIMAYHKLEDTEKAIELIKRALDRDAKNKNAFLWLADIYRERRSFQALADVLQRRLTVEGSASSKVRYLWELSEILFSELKEFDRAKETLKELLKLKPDHSSALELIAGLYEKEEEWVHAADILLRWGRLERTREKLIQIFWRLGVIFDDALKDNKKAVAAFSRVIALDKSNLPALNRLADIHERLEEWKAALAVTGRIVQIESDPAQKIRHYIKLSGILENGYKDIRRAREALRRALEVNPADLNAIEEMAQFHVRREDGSSMMVHLDQSAAVMREKLDDNAFDVEAMRGLGRIFVLRRHKVMAWWCLRALQAFGTSTDQLNFLLDNGIDGRVSPQRLIEPEIDDRLFPVDVPSGLRQVFRLLGDSLWKYYKGDIKKYDLSRSHRLHNTSHEARHVADELAKGFGINGYELYRCEKYPHCLVVEPGDPPIIIVGDSLLEGADHLELEFILARAVKLIQTRMVIPALLKGEELAVLVAAVVRQYIPDHEVLDLDPKLLMEATGRINKMVTRRIRDELMPYAYECSNETLDFTKTGLLVRQAADRAGLLCCGSVEAALSVLRKANGRLDVSADKRVPVDSMRGLLEIEDLLRFIPSMGHMGICERL